MFSDINVDSSIKKIKLKHAARDTFAQFAYGKANESQNDTHKDFAEPYIKAEGPPTNLKSIPVNTARELLSHLGSVNSTLHMTTIALLQARATINTLINHEKTAHRDRNRNHMLTTEQVQLPDGAYDESNDQIFHTEVANDLVFTNCNADRGIVRNFRMQMPNGHGNHFLK